MAASSNSSQTTADLKKWTATQVIEMFQALDLPVTDDEGLIDAKASELKPLYLRMKGKTDPKDRFKADAWFANLAELQQSRAELLEAVRNLFNRLANAALDQAITAGITTLTPDLVAELEHLAQDECKCELCAGKAIRQRIFE